MYILLFPRQSNITYHIADDCKIKPVSKFDFKQYQLEWHSPHLLMWFVIDLNSSDTKFVSISEDNDVWLRSRMIVVLHNRLTYVVENFFEKNL